jgi:hypothetical protein
LVRALTRHFSGVSDRSALRLFTLCRLLGDDGSQISFGLLFVFRGRLVFRGHLVFGSRFRVHVALRRSCGLDGYALDPSSVSGLRTGISLDSRGRTVGCRFRSGNDLMRLGSGITATSSVDTNPLTLCPPAHTVGVRLLDARGVRLDVNAQREAQIECLLVGEV